MFDFIIVGGGSAGCVLAHRLSEIAHWNVCLIEAGPSDRHPLIKIPVSFIQLWRSKSLNWGFYTEPQKYCAERPMFYHRGRTLGGSSAINGMSYVRGNPSDYDLWATLGNPGWSYQDVLPYFKKIENFEGEVDEYHGSEGPLNIAPPRYINPLVEVFVQAGIHRGFAPNFDFNGAKQHGIGTYHVTQKDGARCSNAHAYLAPIRKRKNLTIFTRARVEKIIFEGRCAKGIRLHHHGKTQDIFAHKEVILSAGAVGSPHLLLLSGVGPTEQLLSHGITPVHELSGVGENLQDHLDVPIICQEKGKLSLSFHPSKLFKWLQHIGLYYLKGKGFLTSNVVQAGAFFNRYEQNSWPDFQHHFLTVVEPEDCFHLKSSFQYFGYTLRTCLLHPRSRGRIRLKSCNFKDAPLIDPCFLSDERDLDDLLYGFKKAREFLADPAFKPHFRKELKPGTHIETDEQIRDYIRDEVSCDYHPVGTCKMGPDSMAVVNAQLEVDGLEHLRVIDASVMPTITSGNTNAPVTMIAEKGADYILHKHNL